MSDNLFLTTAPLGTSAQEWSLLVGRHVVVGAIVTCDALVEAHILLDGQLLYRSRHACRAFAEEELVCLRGQWAAQDWSGVEAQ